MSLPILLVTVALATTALSATIPNQSAEKPKESVETFDSSAVQLLPQRLPLTIELPREEPAGPFISTQPDPFLRAPQFNSNPQPNFYQVPIPSEYLIAPTEGVWNPDEDPTLYYELPASITKENYPTNEYPKKFNKDIHTKSKPFATAPKKEIALEPINEIQYLQRQKDLYKTLDKLTKKENQKGVELEKVPIRILKSRTQPQDNPKTILKSRAPQDNPKSILKSRASQDNPKSILKSRAPPDNPKSILRSRAPQDNPKKPKDSVSHQTKLTKSQKVLPKPLIPTTNRPTKKNEFKTPTDSSNSETTFEQNLNSDPESFESKKFTRGLSPKITDSLGLTSNNGAGGQQDRVLFHMVGHDGPMSYKWGFDTGKGHNRQFRYEERDKEGIVKGQFGYYDKEGKFRMMNYDAHPEHGFHMEADPESDIKE